MHWTVGGALFFAVWAIYLADRIFDRGLKLPNQPIRKRFADQHTAWLIALMIVAGFSGVALATQLPPIVWWQAIGVALLTIVYFCLCRMATRYWRLPVKEVLIGVCFAAAIGIPFQREVHIGLLACLFVFGLLCTLNCLLISRDESDFDQQDDPNAWFATRRKTDFRYAWLSILLLTFGLAWYQQLSIAMIIAIVLSTLLLSLLDRKSLKRSGITYLADTCLWVPAIIGLIAS